MQEKLEIKERIIQNRTAVVCLAFLIGLSLTALFAYVIIPDKTNNANRQNLKIALSYPGHYQLFLIKDRQLNLPQKSVLNRLIYGKREQVEYVPIDSVAFNKNMVISHFKGVEQLHVDLQESSIQTLSKTYLFGTDKYGRDVLSRLILGLRISLIVGFLSVMVSLVIGIFLGCLGGYYGGWLDKVIMLVINTGWSIPTLLMAFAVIIAFGKGFMIIVLAVGLTMWVDVARIVRGQTMQVKNELFVKASKVMGFNDLRTITRHILPNMTGTILVFAAANFATAILIEAGLSFLGLGIQPPTPSLGNMLQESYAYATGGFVYLAFFPILTIMLLVLCFNLLGTSLRDVFDIKAVRT